jgi:hypothetical protein
MATKFKAPTQEDIDAISRVLSLAENHQMWSERKTPDMQEFYDDTFAAINKVRDYLEDNGVCTLRALLRQAAERMKGVDHGEF